ncbi:hypothetical protein CHH69_17540 [Terribacillus saccharophilus]|uniref:hypothetical protein n=1 Tax=Terribacillus saccharophilus TaxID=361277 RepID=UPI000BA78F1B|nr:hypothetical protein [Terribacillus saccharophilus]PAF34110.1 hypothetical protein CHH69_17540 [Terribacillus saccharophilus]
MLYQAGNIEGFAHLAMDIAVLLYLLQFPILGPSLTGQFNLLMSSAIFVFCLLYSWMWMLASLFAMRRFERQFRVRSSEVE